MKNADVSRTQGPHSKWMWLKSFSLTYPVEGGNVLSSFLLFFGEWEGGGGKDSILPHFIIHWHIHTYTSLLCFILFVLKASC